MTEQLRIRVESKLIKEADEVCREIGTTPGEVVRLMFKQMVRRRSIPFPLQADAPEDEVLSPAMRRNKLADQF